MNFNAEQQVQLENSRAANTMNLNNLSNRQALVMSEAASLAQLDVSNLKQSSTVRCTECSVVPADGYGQSVKPAAD